MEGVVPVAPISPEERSPHLVGDDDWTALSEIRARTAAAYGEAVASVRAPLVKQKYMWTAHKDAIASLQVLTGIRTHTRVLYLIHFQK